MRPRHWTVADLFSLFRRCLNLLSYRDRRFVGVYALLQFTLVLLDLLGLLLIGAIAAIATSSIQGTDLPNVVKTFLDILAFEESSPQVAAAILGLAAALLLIMKSFLSYYLGLRSYAFLARREASISESLAKRIFNQEITGLNRFTTPQYQHALTNGCSSVMGGVIGQSLALLAEVVLQITMLVTLFLFSPFLTIVSLTFFLGLFLLLNKFQGDKARKWGQGMTNADVDSTRLVADAIGSYREILVSGRRSFFINQIRDSREKAAKYLVLKTMLTQFSKYAFEMSIIVSGLAISAYAFLTKPAIQAASLVVIFITATTRIAPSILKLQQGILQLRGAAGATELFFEIHDSVADINHYGDEVLGLQTYTFHPKQGITLSDVSFSYPKSHNRALSRISLKIPANSSFAIVGPSGSGKSTLVDLILGVIRPQEGSLDIFGVEPKNMQSDEPGKIAYVPQSVYLTSGSILENVGLGINREKIDESRVWNVLERVRLDLWAKGLSHGIHSSVGERGSQLSGGQKQRLGIARALYQDPIMLVLDEATSSLDAESEHEISASIESLKQKITTIIIAHRLSTVINCDQVVYLNEGKIISQGTFTELRRAVPDFDRQANLMGITG